jgi:hypothetical protein
VKTCAILGCGPAGLIAAEAATQAGLTPLIFSRKVKSPMPGAQFLHAPIPGISQEGDEHKIKFIKTGTREGYARKVYGAPDAPCSWDEYPQGERVGWDLPAAYDRLWGKYQERILNGSLTAPILDFIEGSFDIVFSSIPLSYLCENPDHQFFNAKVWIRSWRVAGRSQLRGIQRRAVDRTLPRVRPRRVVIDGVRSASQPVDDPGPRRHEAAPFDV